MPLNKECHLTKTVVVLGPPRSGTSMVAGILDVLGVSFGEVRHADPLNPKGYFENREFLNLGDDIFHAAEPTSHGFKPPPPESLEKQRPYFQERIRQVIEARNDEFAGKIWGWKTTSTCLLINFFLPYLINPHFVVVFRNPISSAHSAMRYMRHEAKRSMYESLEVIECMQAICLYQKSVLDFLDKNKQLPKLILAQEHILSYPENTVRDLSVFLGIEKNVSKQKEAMKFISSPKAMRRHQWFAEKAANHEKIWRRFRVRPSR